MLNDETAEKFRLQQIEWAKADGEARRLEKLEKIIFSELVNQSGAPSISAKEHWARAHKNYRMHCQQMTDARTQANILKGEISGMEMAFEKWRTQQATRRAEMNIR